MKPARNQWMNDEVDSLIDEYNKKGEKESIRDFSKRIANKFNGHSGESIRAKLRKYTGVQTNENAKDSSRIEYTNNSIFIVKASERIMSMEEIMEAYNIDPDLWHVEKYTVRTSEAYRKDRKVEWKVENGNVVYGNVEDSGKMLVVPLFHMELRLVKRVKEENARKIISDIIEDAKNFSPKYPKIHYKKFKDGMLYELAMPDIHFGRLTWHEESGDDFDIKIAEKTIKDALEELLQHTQNYNINRILLPIGNDFFNVNSKTNTTVSGTPQQEDTRWQKTFRAGRKLVIDMIDTCTSIAHTDVLFIPGNHDEEKIFYLGDALECWYRNNSNVSIDNVAKSRKYYDYGKILLGFTHGNSENIRKLPQIMQFEVPQLWGNSVFREWHTGDKHHKTDYILEVDEQIGLIIRVLRSLVPADAWTFNKGFIGSQRAAEAFLWHPTNGLVAQFTSIAVSTVMWNWRNYNEIDHRRGREDAGWMDIR